MTRKRIVSLICAGTLMVMLIGCNSEPENPPGSEPLDPQSQSEVQLDSEDASVLSTVVSTEVIDMVTWDLIQDIGQWDAVSQYLPYMTSDNVEKISEYAFPIYEQQKQPRPEISEYLGQGEQTFSSEPLTTKQLDELVLDLAQRTGNLSLVEPWFDHLSAAGRESVENLLAGKV